MHRTPARKHARQHSKKQKKRKPAVRTFVNKHKAPQKKKPNKKKPGNMEARINLIQDEIIELSSSISQLYDALEETETRIADFQNHEKMLAGKASEKLEKHVSEMTGSLRNSLFSAGMMEKRLEESEKRINLFRKEIESIKAEYGRMKNMAYGLEDKMRKVTDEAKRFSGSFNTFAGMESRLSALDSKFTKERKVKPENGRKAAHIESQEEAAKNKPDTNHEEPQKIAEGIEGDDKSKEGTEEIERRSIQPLLIHPVREEAAEIANADGRIKLKEKYAEYIDRLAKPNNSLLKFAARFLHTPDDHINALKEMASSELHEILLMPDRKTASILAAHLARSFVEICLGVNKATTYSEIADLVDGKETIPHEMKETLKEFFGLMNAKEYKDSIAESDIKYIAKQAEYIISNFIPRQ